MGGKLPRGSRMALTALSSAAEMQMFMVGLRLPGWQQPPCPLQLGVTGCPSELRLLRQRCREPGAAGSGGGGGLSAQVQQTVVQHHCSTIFLSSANLAVLQTCE